MSDIWKVYYLIILLTSDGFKTNLWLYILSQNKLKYCSAVEYKHLCKKNLFLRYRTELTMSGMSRQTIVSYLQ